MFDKEMKTLFEQIRDNKMSTAELIKCLQKQHLRIAIQILNVFPEEEMTQETVLRMLLDYKLSNGYTNTYDHAELEKIMNMIHELEVKQ